MRTASGASDYSKAAESTDQRSVIFLPSSKALFCHSTRASRRIPILFLAAASRAIFHPIPPSFFDSPRLPPSSQS